MKYLSDYIDANTTRILKETGSFFAFSDKQFNEQKKPNIKYVSLSMGLICPEDNVEKYITEMDNNIKNGIAQDMAENGTDNIIARELSNHEAYYTNDLTSTIEALSLYPISKEDIIRVFNNKRNENHN
jgi:hypothetical protein